MPCFLILSKYFTSCFYQNNKFKTKLPSLIINKYEGSYLILFVVSLLAITSWETSCQNTFPYPAYVQNIAHKGYSLTDPYHPLYLLCNIFL